MAQKAGSLKSSKTGKLTNSSKTDKPISTMKQGISLQTQQTLKGL